MTDHGLNIFGVDPGGTTGWAVLWVPTVNLLSREVTLLEDVEFDCGEWSGPDDKQAEAFSIEVQTMRSNSPIIFEDFILRTFRQDRDLLAPVRVTAKMEFALYRLRDDLGVPKAYPVLKQQPSMAKSTATDDRLKDWGLWEPGKPHARDAIRHAVTFLRRAKADRRLRNWAWPELAGL
jgi:hypothetical protein